MNLDIDGITIHCRAEGAGDPVLLVHGFPLTGELWDPLVPALASNHRLIIPDLRGHGRSDASEPASMERYATDLARVLDRLSTTERTVVVGLSMGGYVAMEFVRRFPDHVRALVLANTRASADTAEQKAGREETAARVLRDGSAIVADDMVEKLFAPSAPAELRTRWRSIMAANPPTGVAAALRAMAERPDSFATLQAFDRPILVIAGAEDRITTVADAEAMGRAAPAARVRVIDRAAHMTPVEQPARFAALLHEFLTTLSAESG